MATQTLPSSTSNSTSTSNLNSRRSNVAALRTIGNTALQEDSSDPPSTGLTRGFALTSLPHRGTSGVLRGSVANDRFADPTNIVAFSADDDNVTGAGPSPINHTWADFHHSSTNDNLTVSDVSSQFSAYVKSGGQVSVGALSEEAYDEQLAREREAKPQAANDTDDHEDSGRFLVPVAAVIGGGASQKRHHFRLRRLKFRGEDEEARRKREEEEERRRKEEEAKKKGEKPGEEKPGEKADGKPGLDEHVGADAAGSRDAATGARDTATAARDGTTGVRDAATATRDATAGVRDAATVTRDATLGIRDTATGLKDVAGATRLLSEAGEAANGMRTVWEGSRLLRVGGSLAVGGLAVAGGLAAGTAIFMVGAAAVVGIGAALIVGYATGSKNKALQAGLKWAGESLIPTEARQAWAQHKYFKAIDVTLGLSSFVHLVKGAGHLAWEAIRHPAAAAAAIKSAWQFGGKAIGVIEAIASDKRATNAAIGVASDALTGQSTGQTGQFMGAVASNSVLSQRISALPTNSFAAQTPSNDNAPSPSRSGGRRRDHIVMAANDPVRPSLPTNGFLAPQAAPGG